MPEKKRIATLQRELDLTLSRRDGPGADDPTGESWRDHNQDANRLRNEIERERETENRPCERCGQTGRFITGSMNGRPTGPGGICYRCGGKGHQTPADRRRNYGYDCHAANVAIRADINRDGCS